MVPTALLVSIAILAGPAGAADWPGPPDPAPWSRTAGGVEVQDLAVGDGPEVEPGAEVEVHYTGMLEDGTVFDTSRERGRPFGFRVGARQVIPGWDEGLVGMKVGGRRRLVIPADLGYGDRSAGPIPPNATLYFEIELLGMEPPRRPPESATAVPPDQLQPVRGVEGVRFADLQVGDGKRVRRGGRVCIDFASWRGAERVEHTYARAGCTWYRLDDGDLPPILEGALVGMRTGGRRQVVGPGEPPLVYEVTLASTGK